MSSAKAKKIVIVELTVPWEERCTQAYERKKAKYEDLIQECRQAGWKAWNYPVEVGCRGFPAPSLGKMFQDVGIVGQARKLAIKKASQSAEKSFGLGGTPVAGSRPLMGSVWPTLSPTTLSLSWV